MGANRILPIIPGQSSAQVIDGSVGISSFSNSHLKRDPGSAGNRRTFSFSGWVKKYDPTLPGSADDQVIIEARTSSPAADGDIFGIRIEDDGRISVYDYGNFYVRSGAGRMRDTTGWYHVFFSVDTTVASNNVKLYVNNVLVGQGSHAQNTDTRFNSTDTHRIGARADGTDNYWLNAAVTNFYVIDGQALEPTDFGFTDPLTNTWRPKKYTGTYGTNGFYLPMDGNSPIGQDKSGQGNDWTPVNFGGSNSVEKATGALPILNTVNGGRFATAGVRTDAYANNLVLALPLVGSATDVSNQINSGSTTKVITENGDPTASTTQSNFYGGSFDFDESGDYLSVSSTSDMTFGTGDFTIEGWFYYDATSTPNNGLYQIAGSHLVSNSNTLSCNFETSGGRTQQLYFGSAGGWRQNGTDYEFPFQKWNHVAQVRSSGVIKTYINGKLSQSWDDTTDYTFTHCVVGGYYSSLYLWDGYIQDFRVYKGVAKYTSDFIPASTNPDILPDTPSGVSGSSKLTKITDGAVYFDGNGSEYLTAPWSSDFAFGTGDFTIEMFVYWQGDTSTSTVLSWGVDIDNRFDIGCQTANQIRVFARTGGSTFVNMSVANGISINKWIHLAVVRNSSAQTMKLYIDGVERASTSSVTASMPTDNTVWNGIDIGRRRYGTGASTLDYYEGFIRNLRILKGTALYTTDFTPPTSPLTNVTNTKLLCCQSVGITTAAAVGIISDFSNYIYAPTFNPFNTDINTVRGQETSYATLNPLATQKSGSITLSNGNLTATVGATRTSAYANLPFVGKMYYEVTFRNTAYVFGMAPSIDFNSTANTTPQRFIGESSVSYGVVTSNTVYNNGASIGTISDTFAVNDCMGWAYDSDSGKITIFKNGNDLGTFTASTSRTYYPAISLAGSGAVADVNFGQKPFKFPPPDGFQPLNAANVRPATVIARPDQYVGVTTYNAAGANQIITLGFKPDLIISKARNQSYAWDWEDIVRGGGFKLKSESTDAQIDYSSNAPIREWRRDGIRASTNLNTTYSAGGSSYGVSYGFVAGNTAIPETGAISFDGTGDYLTFASTSAFLGDAGYTIDGWIYLLSAPANSNGEVIFDTGSGGSDPELNVYADGSGNIQLYESLSNNTNWNGGAAYMKVGRWYYFKQTVDGSSASDAAATHKLYVDGQLGVQNTINLSSRSASSTASIAARTDGSVIGNFILSNLRYRDTVDNSTTIPTAPFTGSEANTVLLCCNKKAPSDGAADPTDSTITPSTISKQGNPGDANITIFGRFTKDGVAHASAAAAGLTGGDITPTGASVGTKQGFSIIKFTGSGSGTPSIPHGLSEAPKFIIQKDTVATTSWRVFAYDGSTWKIGNLNNTDALVSATETAPTSSLFYANGNGNATNTQIAYLWHDVPGLQKFGSYEGNGVADGPYIELGFRPAIVLIKNIDTGGTNYDWVLYDNERAKYNPDDKFLCPNLAKAENVRGDNVTDNARYVDFLSNGFKVRNNSSPVNASETIIYAAWAEAPSFNLYGGQSNAR